jgi:hypothetical protein
VGKETSGNYEVGYGRPPRHTRFQKGRSGNPSGRPKGSRNVATLLKQQLNERVEVREKGRLRKITKLEAIVTQLVNKAATGDQRAIELLLTWIPGSQKDLRELGRSPGIDPEMVERAKMIVRGLD